MIIDFTVKMEPLPNFLQENFKALIKLLYRTRSMRSLLSASLSMQRSFPQSAYPLEWICKLHLEYACDTLDFQSDELEGDRCATLTESLILVL